MARRPRPGDTEAMANPFADVTTGPAAEGVSTLPATLRLGAVHLTVTDLERSVAWYATALGLHLHQLDPDAGVAALGDGSDDVLVLHEDQLEQKKFGPPRPNLKLNFFQQRVHCAWEAFSSGIWLQGIKHLKVLYYWTYLLLEYLHKKNVFFFGNFFQFLFYFTLNKNLKNISLHWM